MATEPQISTAEEHWARDWGHLLRLARQVAGLSLTELSARSGLSKGYLSKLESGYDGARNPSRATLAALARELPSFRPLAATLEPSTPRGAVALAMSAPPPPLALAEEEDESQPTPLRLGWRDLEVLLALLTLEAAAVCVPLTALTLARAIGRPSADVAPTLADLAARGLLRLVAPPRPGAAPTYERTDQVATQIGLERLGDALVLAGALLAQAPVQQRRSAPARQSVRLPSRGH